jgi:hypothetical protein
VASSLLNLCLSTSPEYSSLSSAPASASASIWLIFSAMRSNVSNALVCERPLMVSWMDFMASARRFWAMSTFFLRFASSILLLSARRASLSWSVAFFCFCH